MFIKFTLMAMNVISLCVHTFFHVNLEFFLTKKIEG